MKYYEFDYRNNKHIYYCPECGKEVEGEANIDWVSWGEATRYHKKCCEAIHERHKIDHDNWRVRYDILSKMPRVC